MPRTNPRISHKGSLSRYYSAQKLGPGQDPSSRLVLNSRNNNKRRRGHMTKDPSIALFPNFPRNKHDDGGHGLHSNSMMARKVSPPHIHIFLISPGRRKCVMTPAPSKNLFPNVHGEKTFKEKMVCRFLHTVAKGTIPWLSLACIGYLWSLVHFFCLTSSLFTLLCTLLNYK